MPKHLLLNKRQQFALLIHEGINSLIVGQSLIEEYFEYVNARMFDGFLMCNLIEIHYLILIRREVACIILRQFQFIDLGYDWGTSSKNHENCLTSVVSMPTACDIFFA